MQHLDEGLIHAWLDNALPADEAARVAAHAAECGECAAAVAEARGLVAGASRIVLALDVSRGGVMPAPSATPTRSLWRRLSLTPSRAAIAATILLAVGSVFTLRHRPASDGLPVGRMVDSPLDGRQAIRSVPAPRVADTVQTAKSATASPPPVRHVQPTRDTASSAARADLPHDSLAMRPVAAAPAPAAKAMDVAVDSAKTSQGAANLVQGEQKSVVAGAAGARAAARVEATAAATNAPRAALGGFAPTRLESAFLTAPGGGCFVLRPLQGDTTPWLHALPERFALGNERANSSDRVGGEIRIASSAGRVDSVLQGSSWQQTEPGRITVVFDAQRAIELHVAANPMTADASSGGETRTVAVARSICPR